MGQITYSFSFYLQKEGFGVINGTNYILFFDKHYLKILIFLHT